MTTSEMALLTTFESTEVKACWAPMTSLLRRVTRAPVWARVKNATGWRSTWPKTSVRRSKMRPSPMREEYHRWTRVRTPLTSATTATTTERRTTTPRSAGTMPSSTIDFSSRGVATTSAALTTTSARKTRIWGR